MRAPGSMVKSWVGLGLALLLAPMVGACAGGSGSLAGGDIVIGASIPLSGPLVSFGNFEKWGYEHAVQAVDDAGGLRLAGARHRVRLVLLDDRSDPNLTSSNTDRLVNKERVVGLLGSCTPELVNAGGIVAERAGVPMVTACDPLEAFKNVKKWSYVWDIFFDEPDLAVAPFLTMDAWATQTNKRIAILTDDSPSGQIVGDQIYPALVRKFGYTVAYRSSFPVDSVQFGSLIEHSKAADADIVLTDAQTPGAVAMREQMAGHGYTPRVLVNELGAEPVQYATALDRLADGVIVGGYWDSSFPFPGARELRQAFESETRQTFSQHIADSDAAAAVLLDAIGAAGSVDHGKLNSAIAATNKTYVVGQVKFDGDHTSKLPIVELQWQGGKTVVVWPRDRATGSLLFPLPGA